MLKIILKSRNEKIMSQTDEFPTINQKDYLHLIQGLIQ